ncbi:hypothetical protein [Brevibacterium album]|uniref:hypothetical protein n=1 Tax=Brevibacterium album TaxID=417948 RepID=UPI0003FE997F|nr:hypothetical protein [Brevibacterium album]
MTYLSGLSAAWSMDEDGAGPRTTYVFTRTPASFGDGLSCNFRAAEAGRIGVVAEMSVLNPGQATWAAEPGVDDAEVR